MKIEIETKGTGEDTIIKINGEEVTRLKLFEFSINSSRSNKVKLSMTRNVNGTNIPMEFFGEGVRKFDEATLMQKENDNGKFIGKQE